MAPRKRLVFSLLLLISILSHPPSTHSSNLIFDFPSFNSLRNLTLLGDSYLQNGVVGLTRQLTVPVSSSGTLIYKNPIQFLNPQSNSTVSFSTNFSFSINNINPTSFGDGLTFFLSPENQTLGSSGGYLGLVNSTRLTKNRFIAVEFDTKLDLFFDDPNENHVGFDIDSLNSIETADVNSQQIDLKSGDLINAWIDYKNDLKRLSLFLSYSGFKPEKPLLNVDIDLSDHLNEFMFVGFSGSTEGSTELHIIERWSFETFGFRETRPRNEPHNVSDSSVALNPPIPVSDSTNNHHRRLNLGLGIAGPGLFCVAMAIFGWVYVNNLKNARTEKSFKAELITGPRQFSFKEIKLATRGFHQSRIIGDGAFGTVYKAIFKSSGTITISAVKRSRHTHEGKSEFLAELNIIACLRHKNLVQLQGWCVEKGELLLVYEFMPNGSLDKVLYMESVFNPLKWGHRYNIAIGLASVLAYLHQECEQVVIHRDIKTSNVILDGNFNPRLADFGLARLMDHDKSPVSTLTAGTMGYLAPEYLQYGKATEKTDVFSYGVVVLEVACGRRPIEREENGGEMVNLVDWVWGLYYEGRVMDAADQRLDGEFHGEEMKKLLVMGLSCANPCCAERPTMRRVLQILNNEAEPVVVPKRKPGLSFSSGLSFTLEDLVAEV